MKITGELLKAERLKKNLSVQDVAYALKLSARIIQAIENGDTSELPAKTFVRGFVKSYADYLKVDVNLVLKQFQEEMGSTHPVPKTPPPSILPPEETSQTAGLKKSEKSVFAQEPESLVGGHIRSGLGKNNVYYFAAVAGLVIAIVLVNKIISRYQSESVDSQTPVAQSEKATTAVSATTTAEMSTVSGSATTDINTAENQSSTKEDENKNLSSKPVDNQKQDEPKAAKAEDKTVPHIEKSKGLPVEVLIEARKDAYIEYAKGNTAQFNRVLIKANTFQILKSATGLHLKSTDGANLILTVNGINKGPMSPSNKPTELTY